MKAKIYSIGQLEGVRKAPYEEGKKLNNPVCRGEGMRIHKGG
jgi:hypothetical protein